MVCRLFVCVVFIPAISVMVSKRRLRRAFGIEIHQIHMRKTRGAFGHELRFFFGGPRAAGWSAAHAGMISADQRNRMQFRFRLTDAGM